MKCHLVFTVSWNRKVVCYQGHFQVLMWGRTFFPLLKIWFLSFNFNAMFTTFYSKLKNKNKIQLFNFWNYTVGTLVRETTTKTATRVCTWYMARGRKIFNWSSINDVKFFTIGRYASDNARRKWIYIKCVVQSPNHPCLQKNSRYVPKVIVI